jgi:PTS system nitrogen regulatory IIA component
MDQDRNTTPPLRSEALPAATRAALLEPGHVLISTRARDAEALFEEMAAHLVRLGRLAEAQPIVDLLMRRERICSTGLCGGFAIPHAYLEDLPAPGIVMTAVSKRGVDFGALDGEPVHVAILVLGSKSRMSDHVRLLAHLSRLLREQGLCERIRAAETPEAVLTILQSLSAS